MIRFELIESIRKKSIKFDSTINGSMPTGLNSRRTECFALLNLHGQMMLLSSIGHQIERLFIHHITTNYSNNFFSKEKQSFSSYLRAHHKFIHVGPKEGRQKADGAAGVVLVRLGPPPAGPANPASCPTRPRRRSPRGPLGAGPWNGRTPSPGAAGRLGLLPACGGARHRLEPGLHRRLRRRALRHHSRAAQHPGPCLAPGIRAPVLDSRGVRLGGIQPEAAAAAERWRKEARRWGWRRGADAVGIWCDG